MTILRIDRQYNWKLVTTENDREYYCIEEPSLMLLVIQDGRGIPQVGELVDASTGTHDGGKYPRFVSLPGHRFGKISVRKRDVAGAVEGLLSNEIARAPKPPDRERQRRR